jgi:hypothetical protein
MRFGEASDLSSSRQEDAGGGSFRTAQSRMISQRI